MAAVSCGIWQGTPVLDLDYAEDSTAETDANFVLTGAGGLVEIQGTAEGAPFSEEELAALVKLARKGIGELIASAETGSGDEARARSCVVASHNPGKVREIRRFARTRSASKPKARAELRLAEPEETGTQFRRKRGPESARSREWQAGFRHWPMIPAWR